MIKKLQLKRKNILFVCFLVLMTVSSNAQQNAIYSWAKGFTNNSIASVATVVTDDSGNVYSAGFFYTNLVSLGIANKGSSDILLMKHSATGALKWVKTIASASLETADGIAIDANQNIYIVGRYEATTDFDPSTGIANLTPKGGIDIFMAKYTTNGDYVWSKGIGGTGTEAVNKIVVDATGSVYITGLFNATVDFNPGAGVANLSSNGATVYDAFFAKYTTSGNYVWAKSIGSTGEDKGYGIAVDVDNNVYIAGEFQGTADFNPSSTATNNLTAAGTNDMYYAKYDANGAYVWAKRVGTASNYVSARDIKLDADKNIYVVGVFEANTDFDPSTNVAIVNRGGVFTGFVAKYNSAGNYVWAFGNGGSGSIYHIQMCLDKLKSVYVTGFFDNTCDFDPSTATANLTSAGNEEMYLAKYDTDGKYKWAKRIGGTGNDQSGGIAVDTLFNVVISGYYSGTVDFDPSAATANLTSVAGTSSAFIARYKQTGICLPIATTFSVTACDSYTWVAKGNKIYTANNNTDTIHLTTAGGCDSLVTLNLTIYKSTSATTNISACSSYTWNSITYTSSGIYTYNTVNANGCDSVATLNLVINKPSVTVKEITICNSQLPYTFNGLTFTQEGKQSIVLTNASGCDSLVTYVLSTVKDGILDNAVVVQPACDSSFGTITASIYHYSRVFRGTIDATDQKQIGRLNITAQPTTSCSVTPTNPGLLSGDTKQRFYESYILTNTTGATACVSVNLTNYNSSNFYSVAAYINSFNPSNPSQNYLGHLGKVLSLGNDYFYISVPANATFEIVVSTYLSGNFFGDYTLEVGGLEKPEFSINNGLNWQNSAVFNNAPIGNNILKMRTIGTQCEVQYFNNPVVLNAKAKTSSTADLSICSNQLPYSWNGLTFTAAGSQTKTGLVNSKGCDSSATLNLTVKTATSSTTNLTICPSDLPYSWNGLTFNDAGSQTKTGLVNSIGCDSSATLNLFVKPLPNAGVISGNSSFCFIGGSTTLTSNGDAGGVWSSSNSSRVKVTSGGKVTATVGGNYIIYYTVTNSCGNAVASFNIKVNVPSSSTLSLSACNSYTWNGTTYTATGVYTKTGLTNAGGCDSTATLELTIKATSASTSYASICSGGLYIFNGNTYFKSGKYLTTLTNSVGCDSIATLILVVKASSASTTNASICNGSSYTFNGKTYTASGTYKATLTNSVGCDSIATLILTVKTATTSTTNLSICASALPYSWNGLTFTAAGSQTKTGLVNSQGCDSSATLNLTVKLSTVSDTIRATINQGQSYTFNGVPYNTTGIYFTKLVNAVGCDSTAILSLTVIAPYAVTGNIIHPTGTAVQRTSINVNAVNTTTVNTAGNYSLSIFPNTNFTIRPSKNNDVAKANGVSSLDIVLIQSHILNKALLNSPYKIIAADVNNSGEVSTVDLLLMKRLILTIDTLFPSNRLWAFVDSSYSFPNPLKPFPYKDSIRITNLSSNTAAQTFIGVKLGDVNYDWDPATLGVRKESQPLVLEYQPMATTAASSQIRIPIKVNHFDKLLSLQFTLHFDATQYSFTGIDNNLLQLDYGTNHSSKGAITFLWTDPQVQPTTLADGTTILELVLTKRTGITTPPVLQISSSHTPIEAWDGQFAQHQILMKAATTEVAAPLSESYSLSPNPTEADVFLTLQLATSKTLRVTVSNAAGQKVKELSINAPQGQSVHALSLRSTHRLAAGVYYIDVQGMDNRSVKKLVIR